MLASLIDGPKDFCGAIEFSCLFVLIHLALFMHGWRPNLFQGPSPLSLPLKLLLQLFHRTLQNRRAKPMILHKEDFSAL